MDLRMVGSAAALAVALAAGAAEARDVVRFDGAYAAGTVVVKTGERKLYYVLGGGQAIRYPIAVGMPGREWSGQNSIARKEVNPVWQPPAEVRHDKPALPQLVPPGPSNPLGPRAMVLAWGEYAIHGTNKPSSIGTRASYGCIRMYNEHVVDLFDRVQVGTPVVVTP
ncbi:L,D-transpeptidase [Prosthecomicrobium sp. N25]|uniref:L,D-transpeptidase n=1 Tax=Prosthecomicrobium sp. N25 TaxID=3129254 RepID=UPI00307700A6